MVIGLGMYVPHLMFFAVIFHTAAIPLWLIAALPVGIFLLLLQLAHRRFGAMGALWLTPILWTGLEYFRGELWYLRFAWLLPGQAVAFIPGVRMGAVGRLRIGVSLCIGRGGSRLRPRARLRIIGLIARTVCFAIAMYLPPLPATPAGGVFCMSRACSLNPQVGTMWCSSSIAWHDAHPQLKVLVLSEYTFSGPVPPSVREVLKKHRRYLIAGGAQTLADGRYYDTAFVVGPDGQDIFSQAKSVPVQFMSDGLPAPCGLESGNRLGVGSASRSVMT